MLSHVYMMKYLSLVKHTSSHTYHFFRVKTFKNLLAEMYRVLCSHPTVNISPEFSLFLVLGPLFKTP